MLNLLQRVKRASVVLRVYAGIPVRLQTEDRQVLEETIFPFLRNKFEVSKVMFVGAAWYTAHYPKLMPRAEFWTIEPVPSRRRYGARLHIVDALKNLGKHSIDASFDLIILNGVIGYGLDDPIEINESIASVHRALRSGGELVLGWDDVDGRRPVVPEKIPALDGFIRNQLTPFGSFRHALNDENRKTYDFYIKH